MSGPTAPSGTFRLRRPPAGLPLVVLALLLAVLATVCIDLISSARAYVAGESRWSQGQKGATLALLRYAQTGEPEYWTRFEQAIRVPLGDRQARLALERDPLDRAAVRAGFLQGANHPDDIDGMIRLFRWFRQVPFMDRTIRIWAEADELAEQLQATAQELHAAVQAGADAQQRDVWGQRVLALDAQLSPLEQRFSDTLGEAARTTQRLLTGLMALATVLLTAAAVVALRHAARHEREQAEALRASQAQRDRALRGSSDGFWEWDLKRRTAYFSPRFEELLGYEPGTLPHDVPAVQALQHPQDQLAARAALKRHLNEGAPYEVEVRMRHRDGNWRWLRSRAQSDRGDDGQELRLAGSISDITEQRQAEDALRRREAMFRSLWETTSDAVLIVDTRHHIRFANPAAHELFGHNPGTLPGQPLSLLQPERMQHGHRQGADRYVRDGTRRLDWRSSEVMGRHARGHEIPMEICFSELELDGERHFVGFLRDISRRKQAERALHDANEGLEQRVAERTAELTRANERLRELDRMKSEFLATMSHELRTPLNSIIGFTDLLRRGMSGPLNTDQQRQLGHVHSSGHHLLALINDVLDLSRIESGRMEVSREPCNFADIATEVLAHLRTQAEAKGLAMQLDLAPNLQLLGDSRKIYQVLLNLVNNAIKFTPAGSVQVRARAVDGQLQVAVTDTGVGMSLQQQGQLFQAFRQLDGSMGRGHEGTGLGLHLSRKLLALMHGDIGVDSALGRGSTFHFRLPLVLPEAAPADAVGAPVAAGPASDPATRT